MHPEDKDVSGRLALRNYTNSAAVLGRDGLVEDRIPIITARTIGRGRWILYRPGAEKGGSGGTGTNARQSSQD